MNTSTLPGSALRRRSIGSMSSMSSIGSIGSIGSIAAALSALLLTACGPGGTATADAHPATAGPTLAVDASAAGLLPSSIKASKTLRVAIPTNEPPVQFYRAGTKEMTGINPDLARLLGQALGVTVEIKVVNFDQIIPGIAAGRYDLTVSSMTPTADRMKVLDFVDYLQIGTSVAVPKGNPLKLDQNSLCGKGVGVLTGSYQLTVDVPTLDKACSAAGKPAIKTAQYQDTRQAVSALTSGRQEAVLADSPILSYAAKQSPAIAVASTFELAPVGVGMPKSSGLVKAVAAALSSVITTPAYQQALGTYGLESAALHDARVNFAQ